jgi:ribosome maturation factor RimP
MKKPQKPGKDQILTRVKPAVDAACHAQDATVVSVDLVDESGNWFLKVTVDRPGGIPLSACEKINRQLGKDLDRMDAIPFAYYLEVSSPGISEEEIQKALSSDEPGQGGSHSG